STRTLLAPVTGVLATGVSTSQIDLTWNDTSGESAYRIERSLNGTTWALITTTAADASSYSDMSLAAGTTYYYRVRAVNAGGNSLVTANTAGITVPLGTTLTVLAVSSTQIKLSWLNVLGEAGYRIECSSDGSSGWSLVATTAANVLSYVHGGL